MTTRTYENEFGPEYRLKPHELAQLQTAGLDDISWHNDACPSWALFHESDPDQPVVRIFVDANEPTEREGYSPSEPEACSRISVHAYDLEGADVDCLYDGNRLDEAIAQAIRYRDRIREQTAEHARLEVVRHNLAYLQQTLIAATTAAKVLARSVETALELEPLPPEASLLDEALRLLDLDEAAKLLQDALGVTTGDLAGVMLSGLDPETDDEPTIREALLGWIEAEVTNLDDDAILRAARALEAPPAFDAPAARDWLWEFLTGIRR